MACSTLASATTSNATFWGSVGQGLSWPIRTLILFQRSVNKGLTIGLQVEFVPAWDKWNFTGFEMPKMPNFQAGKKIWQNPYES